MRAGPSPMVGWTGWRGPSVRASGAPSGFPLKKTPASRQGFHSTPPAQNTFGVEQRGEAENGEGENGEVEKGRPPLRSPPPFPAVDRRPPGGPHPAVALEC
jgi:hypothetical protein